jgi:N-acetylneuraminic acid mutarotase
MKKAYAYLVGTVLISSSFILSQGCTKSSTTDDDLIGNWKRSDDYEGNARSEAVSFTIGDYVYVGTGSTATERFNDIWEYSIARKYWSDVADLPGVARKGAVAFAIGSKGYIGTGYDGVSRMNDFWEYDQSANQWSRKADFAGSARYDAVGFAIGNKGYISCGYDGNYLKDLWEYTPGANAADPGTWTKKASTGGTKRAAATAFVFSGKAYIVSGNNNGEIQQDLQMYDPAADEWTEKTKIYNYSENDYDDDWGTIPRQNAVAFVIGNYVYLTGGENGSLNSTTWRYDPANDTWAQKTAFEGTARTGAVAFSLNNRGFVLTGRSGSLMMDNMYEFLPDAEQVDND